MEPPLLLLPLPLVLLLLLVGARAAAAAGDGCSVGSGCDLALGSYLISQNENVTYIAETLFGISNYRLLIPYNPGSRNLDFIPAGGRVNVTFSCRCQSLPSSPSSTFLASSVPYRVSTGDTYLGIANHYNNLTTEAWLQATNAYPANNIPDSGTVNVNVNCSCGDPDVSKEYGLFLTYPLGPNETLASVAPKYDFASPDKIALLRKYNPGMDAVTGRGLVYIPVPDPNGSYRPLKSSGNGTSTGAIAGGVVAGVVALVVGVLFFLFYRRRKAKQAALLASSEDSLRLGSAVSMEKVTPSTTQTDGTSSAAGITVDKSVEFSYEELFNATEGFNIIHKIGQGGFGAVYYAELRGEKAAIKKMDMQATHEFLAELKVLTHVHHLNLVRLIGYCTESSLFLVYEFIENGNLSQHLRGTGYEPLSWAERVQIALDSARGLEYIHEHTVPVYIHRDIKSANILIDKNSRAKVADFGLTKLTEVGGASLQTRVVGTFGYMPPEYARYGDVSPKVDVYAFGVVLYELISAKDAIVRSTESSSDSKGLVYLFEEALAAPDPKEGLRKLIDPKLGDEYPIDAILKMTHLANACTQEDPKLRPTMRSVVVALMTLSSTSEFWDMNSLYENPGLASLMAGR
ncbi:chitin elicitor receptor kinase 1 [Brachypodium distachyon]|uniref:chitin elicitor receptor kinase 1 n=1 Tax=Brachypodium distachyon TaxID=15368 RepID=UPI00052FEA5E|nr:chitin elicitor receptor kinase 1 [Brachypodium distachyon]|eukprot:XP_010235348.1 chitin elicitor receptor kinase 1 [Brachypodium distachyon]